MAASMELKLDRSAFVSALHKAQGVVDKKSTVSVLSHVLLRADAEGTVRLTGTDFDVILDAEVPAEVLSGGSACVNGKSLFDVVKNAGDSAVHLNVLDNHWVEVTAGRSRFKLAGIPSDDFPEISRPAEVEWLTFDAAILKDCVEKTAFSVSDDETRMNLNGVFFKVDKGTDSGGDDSDKLARVQMVSTDGHRLSKVEVETEAEGYKGGSFEAIVHKKGIGELKRLLDANVESVDVGFGKGVVLFRSGGTTFTVRQIEDTYPDYQRVIPPSAPVKIQVDRKRMIEAVRRIAILTSSKTYIIKVELSPGQMAFTSSNPDYGEGRDEFDVEYDGEGLVIGFNYQYLLEVLNVLRGEHAVMEFTDEYGASVVTSPAEPGALFVVMPMRI